MDIYENLKKCDIELPEKLNAAGLYKPVNQTGNLIFVSGQGSMDRGKNLTGRVGGKCHGRRGAVCGKGLRN